MPSSQLLQSRREGLQAQHDLLSEKIARLRAAHAVEAAAAVRFQLDKQIEEAQAELDNIEQRLEALEGEAAGDAAPLAENDLPAVNPNFTGRGEDVERVLERLERERIVTLTGLGGIGKSEAAKAAAHAAVGREWAADGVLYVDLQSATDANALQSALVAGLRLQPAANAAALARQLSGRRLYVLDDLYQALVGDRKGVRALIRALHDFAAPTARFLLTCREPIRVPGVERLVELPELSASDAADLFNKLAGFYGYTWRAGDEARRDALLRDLDGYPLALTIAASWLEGATLETVLARWQDRRTEALNVPGIEEGDLDQLTSVDYSLALSYENLPEGDARLLFALFADLPAGATEDTLKAVMGERGADAVMHLRSLVQWRDGRHMMLVPVREFAARTATDTCEPLREKLDAYLLALAKHWCGDERVWIPRQGEAIRLLSAELPNLHAVMDRAQARSDNVFLADLTDAISRFYAFGLAGMGAKQRLQDGAAAAHATGDTFREVNCIQRLGRVHRLLGENLQAWQCYQEALPLCRSVGDKQGEANCIRRLGDRYVMFADYGQARRYYQDALLLYQSIGDTLREANCIRSLGHVHRLLAEYQQARQRYQEALILYRAIGSRLGEAHCIRRLGDVHLSLAEHEQARQCYQEALSLCQSVGDHYIIAVTFSRMGELCAAEGNREEAVRWMEQAAELFGDIGVLHQADRAREQAEAWRRETAG